MIKVLRYIIRFIPVLISTIAAFVSIFSAASVRLEAEIAEQKSRIAALEAAYANGEIASVDEASFFAGDLEAELEAGMKFNEISFIATHNSYQTPAIDETKKVYQGLSELTFGLIAANTGDFWSETLTQQLNCGIRSFEMDIETFDRDGEISFTCMHSPYIEMATSCYDFALAMKEISMWSDNNPDHLPITIIIEPKGLFIPLEDMEFFKLDYAGELDNVLRKTLGDKLFTPADMLRDYSSFGEMRKADDWCRVSDMLGKVLVLMHECDVTEEYIETDPSIKSQAMFPMLREGDIDRDCTSIILCNKPEKLLKLKADLDERNILVRTRTDEFVSVTEERRENALKSNALIISTDYPVRTDNTAESYVVSFGGNKTVRKVTEQNNPVEMREYSCYNNVNFLRRVFSE